MLQSKLFDSLSSNAAEFPAKGRSDVLPGWAELRGGHVQQRELGASVRGVSGSAGRASAPQGLGEIPSSAGQQE